VTTHDWLDALTAHAALSDGPRSSPSAPHYGDRFDVVRLPPSIDGAGYAYGRACAHLFEPATLLPYLMDLGTLNRTDLRTMSRNADRWAQRLPQHFQAQIDAMAAGAGVAPGAVRAFLYADIAAPADQSGGAVRGDIARDGPMCSGLVIDEPAPHSPHSPHSPRGTWVGRNCDWYEATLRRGTAAVFHRVPHRIPCVAVGLMGDIDADTGLNAEGLWLHMHTLLARDEPRAGVSCISWLFWMREALETCATLADVERFIASTDRDRGVLLFAVDGRTRERAVFECSRSGYTRVDPWDVLGRRVLIATNHPAAKHPRRGGEHLGEAPLAPTSATPPRVHVRNGTISRYCRLVSIIESAHPEHLPHDLAEVLADPHVEMREASGSASLRTIYSAVAEPARREIHFASGACPAASRGTWRRIDTGW
jgi:hypothetical protein